MHHCVYTYAQPASNGSCAIFSMRRIDELTFAIRATIEVELPARTIRQARRACNEPIDAEEMKLLRRWADVAGLTIPKRAVL
jgi:hypothetical protein